MYYHKMSSVEGLSLSFFYLFESVHFRQVLLSRVEGLSLSLQLPSSNLSVLFLTSVSVV